MVIINAAGRARRSRVVGAVLTAALLLAFGTACSDSDSDDARPAASNGTPSNSAPANPGPPRASPESNAQSKPTTDPSGGDDPSTADRWAGKADVVIFLCTRDDARTDGCAGGEVTAAERSAIAADLDRLPEVRELFHETRQQAYQRFKEAFKDSALAASVTPDQLPESFRVKLHDPAKADAVVAAFRDRPGVSEARRIAPKQP